MIEAMACGTPVVAFRRGSALPEVIDEGVTGAIVGTTDEAIAILPRVVALDRRAIRKRFEERFSCTRMATDYVALYRSLLARPSISVHEALAPVPILEDRLNGKAAIGGRGSRAPEAPSLM